MGHSAVLTQFFFVRENIDVITHSVWGDKKEVGPGVTHTKN
jgi:hypothetical protein